MLTIFFSPIKNCNENECYRINLLHLIDISLFVSTIPMPKQLPLPLPLIKFIAAVVLIGGFFIDPWILPTLIIIAAVVLILMSNKGANYLKLQKTLPTSDVRTLQEGLVEIQGRVQKIEVLHTPADHRECVAYTYRKYRESRDSEGNVSKKTIETDEQAVPFMIQDATGSIEVSVSDLGLLWLPEKDMKDKQGIGHHQTFLRHNDEVLLVGEAKKVDGKMIMVKSEEHDVFHLSPVAKLEHWNYFRPLVKSMKLFAGLLFLLSIALTQSNLFIQSNDISGGYLGLAFDFISPQAAYLPLPDWVIHTLIFDGLVFFSLFGSLLCGLFVPLIFAPILKLFEKVSWFQMLFWVPFILCVPVIFIDLFVFWTVGIDTIYQNTILVIQYLGVFVYTLWNRHLIAEYVEKFNREKLSKFKKRKR